MDGHAFIGHALGRGAIAALIESDCDPAILAAAGATYVDARQAIPSSQQAALSAPLVIRVDETLTALQKLATYWRERHPNVRVIGITGSIGKTSTKELVAQVLVERFQVLKSEGNQNNAIGVPLTLLRLNEMHECAVLEMGMDRLGEITDYCKWAKPEIGAVTNIGPVHLENLARLKTSH